jgi:phage gp36-like protein
VQESAGSAPRRELEAYSDEGRAAVRGYCDPPSCVTLCCSCVLYDLRERRRGDDPAFRDKECLLFGLRLIVSGQASISVRDTLLSLSKL